MSEFEKEGVYVCQECGYGEVERLSVNIMCRCGKNEG